MEEKLKHLEMIQSIINRMGNNSFLLKSWIVVLVSALFALSAKNSHISFIYLAYFPALAFWILDGYFLRQERLYRKLYDNIRKKDHSKIDFSMDTSSVTQEVDPWIKTIFSKTLFIFYGIMIGAISIVMLILLKGK